MVNKDIFIPERNLLFMAAHHNFVFNPFTIFFFYPYFSLVSMTRRYLISQKQDNIYCCDVPKVPKGKPPSLGKGAPDSKRMPTLGGDPVSESRTDALIFRSWLYLNKQTAADAYGMSVDSIVEILTQKRDLNSFSIPEITQEEANALNPYFLYSGDDYLALGLDIEALEYTDFGRGSAQYQNLRTVVLERDNYCCALTGRSAVDGPLEVHHISGFAENPQLRFQQRNCITLAADVHLDYHQTCGFTIVTQSKFVKYCLDVHGKDFYDIMTDPLPGKDLINFEQRVLKVYEIRKSVLKYLSIQRQQIILNFDDLNVQAIPFGESILQVQLKGTSTVAPLDVQAYLGKSYENFISFDSVSW
jgi:hypothetical protein